MLDASLPLTVGRVRRVGQSATTRVYYEYMKSYAPYENVRAASSIPQCLITAGLNDPRVPYWEPAKWTAKLRAIKTDDQRSAAQDQHGRRTLRRLRPIRTPEGNGFQLRVPLPGRTRESITDPIQNESPAAATEDPAIEHRRYREGYANSVQVRVSLWDFFLLFGTINQTTPDARFHPEFSRRIPEPAAGQGAAQRAAAERLAVRIHIRRDQAGAKARGRDSVKSVSQQATSHYFFLAFTALPVATHLPYVKLPYYWDEPRPVCSRSA